MLKEALLGAIVGCAGQARQVNEERDFRRLGLRGEEEVEVHFAFGGSSGMAELEEFAAKRGNCCFGCDGHSLVANCMWIEWWWCGAIEGGERGINNDG